MFEWILAVLERLFGLVYRGDEMHPDDRYDLAR